MNKNSPKFVIFVSYNVGYLYDQGEWVLEQPLGVSQGKKPFWFSYLWENFSFFWRNGFLEKETTKSNKIYHYTIRI